MICPQCENPAPGGHSCPTCQTPVPARESFGGLGGHYLYVLISLSLVLMAVALFIAVRREGWDAALDALSRSEWLWLYILVLLAPVGIGLYYWFLLRGEEISVTDAYIARRSHWGSERLLWSEVVLYRRRLLPFRQTRPGRIAWLSRLLSNHRLLSRIPPYAYELIGAPDANGVQHVLRLEPGTIEDLPWLLRLIEERVGPPQEA